MWFLPTLLSRAGYFIDVVTHSPVMKSYTRIITRFFDLWNKIPSFFVATNIKESCEAAEKIGYPVFLKIDASSGGSGVFECIKPSDFDRSVLPLFFRSYRLHVWISSQDLAIKLKKKGKGLIDKPLPY